MQCQRATWRCLQPPWWPGHTSDPWSPTPCRPLKLIFSKYVEIFANCIFATTLVCKKIPCRCLSQYLDSRLAERFDRVERVYQEGPARFPRERVRAHLNEVLKKSCLILFRCLISFSLFDCSMLFCYFSLFDCSLTSSHSAWSSLPLVLNSIPPQLMTPSKDLFLVFQQGHIRHFQFRGCIYQQSACSSRTSPAR